MIIIQRTLALKHKRADLEMMVEDQDQGARSEDQIEGRRKIMKDGRYREGDGYWTGQVLCSLWRLGWFEARGQSEHGILTWFNKLLPQKHSRYQESKYMDF